MQSSPRMRAVITALITKHKVDLQQIGAHLRLNMPGYDRLCIERIGSHRISVAHYFETNGDLVAEPDIVFYVVSDGDWFPIAISQSLSGWREYVKLNDLDTIVVLYQPQAQRSLARFAEMWAENISAQGWLEEGILSNGQTDVQEE